MGITTFYHTSVLKDEAIVALNIRPDGIYVDGTFGGGGHSRAILERLNDKGRLIAFDQDADAWQNAPDDKRLIPVKESFRYLRRFLKLYDAMDVDGILVDLGVSSFQFDTAERGFSTRYDGELDMRMDTRQRLTAKDIIREYDEQKLHELFGRYGEVRNAKTLAQTIVAGRKGQTVNTIAEFKALIENCIKGNPNRYLAQVFQALRIAVNDELDVLKLFLQQAADCLKPGGRLCVITFHSLEDRIVKRFLKTGGFTDERATDVFGKYLQEPPFRALKPVLPGDEELKRNPRSRSARLRIGEKLGMA
ncbi:MAG TPA: 16S rRNA (cytosine(1402)-N(4))-methyltransferase RsmH [Edaphocola sp.]|nr:16S rRNA (cytosine(1402)-N(4))-methyltransferase RsmH [Edaphocola sp.]